MTEMEKHPVPCEVFPAGCGPVSLCPGPALTPPTGFLGSLGRTLWPRPRAFAWLSFHRTRKALGPDSQGILGLPYQCEESQQSHGVELGLSPPRGWFKA